MRDPDEYTFNNITREMIKKSLFTEQQIKIILNQLDLQRTEFRITRGAYYRQVGQSREKLVSFLYTLTVLMELGILLPEDMDVIKQLGERIDVRKSSDVSSEFSDKVMDIVDTYVRRVCRM